MAPLKKYRARAEMEAARQNTSNDLHFRRPRVPQAAVVMVMSLALHTKDPDGVGGAINILLFPDLSPSVGLEDALLTRKCNMILGGGGHPGLLLRHQYADEERKSHPHLRMGQSSLPTGSLDVSLCSVPSQKIEAPGYFGDFSARQVYVRSHTASARSSVPEACLTFHPPMPDVNGVQRGLLTGAVEVA